jgi:ribonuclease-3
VVNIAYLQEILGVAFNDPSLLEMALVHSSYINENPGLVSDHNERLEFLGDAVLGLIVAEKLYRDFPEFTEGEMTKLRSALVRRQTLARIARVIKLGGFLYMGKGEESGGGRDKTANLAGALESVIAAAFLDQGAATARNLVLRLLGDELTKVVGQGMAVDCKSQLQELMQSRHQPIPTYRLVEETGPDHDKMFTVEVMSGDVVLGRGTGKSKKSAETEAARSALEKLPPSFTG